MTLLELKRRLAEGGMEEAAAEARVIFRSLGSSAEPPAPHTDSATMGIDEHALQQALTRRLRREPLAYIVGESYFYRERYRVTPDCLIPRPETELLVAYAVRHLPPRAHFADLCTGSGCVAISTLAARPDCTAVALDLSEAALTLAAQNARDNGVADRLTLHRGDLLTQPFDPAPFDALLSNPPYIARDVLPTLSPELAFEPLMALDGGADGLDFYRVLVRYAQIYIYKEGFCALEIGYDQGDALRQLAATHGLTARIQQDYAGHDRLAILRCQP
ncbi:MAG: peptide chain release factor N(5)-glutamine methyltransferase [Eubacteriales bacterium]